MAERGERAGAPPNILEPVEQLDMDIDDERTTRYVGRFGINGGNNASTADDPAAQLAALGRNAGIISENPEPLHSGVGCPATNSTGRFCGTANDGNGMEIGNERTTDLVNRSGTIGGHNASNDADPIAH